MKLSVGQINVGRSINATAEVRRHLDSNSINIITIQEPYFKHGTNWAGCRLYYGAKPGDDIWTLTVVKDSAYSVVMNTDLSNQYCTLLDILPLRGHAGFLLVNAYFRYNEPIEPHIAALEEILDQHRDRFIIITADINAKTYTWYNEVEDDRGRKFENSLLSNDLLMCNVKTKLTTFENARGHRSNIDVTVSTQCNTMKVVQWRIDDRPFLSGH